MAVKMKQSIFLLRCRTLLLNRIPKCTRVIHFFSFTGRKEMNKSAIAMMLNRITASWNKNKNAFSRIIFESVISTQ
jgi:hypothetical protein